MAIIVMRHGHRNSGVDPPLAQYPNVDSTIWTSILALSPLIEQGRLHTIVTSPYLRTRQTAELVRQGIHQLTGIWLPVKVDSKIGEYIHRCSSHSKTSANQFDAETLGAYNGKAPLGRESLSMCVLRVGRFLQEIKNGTLIITHNSIISIMGQLMEIPVKSLGTGEWTTLSRSSPVGTPRAIQG